MTAEETIRRVLSSGVLSKNLTCLPNSGATQEQIRSESAAIGRELSEQHRRLLASWNGAVLDLITFFGCSPTDPEIPEIRKWQSLLPKGTTGDVVVGFSPAGFLFVERSDSSVYSVDSEGGEVQTIASSLDDFVSRYLFGKDADLFAGDGWKQELLAAGVVSKEP